MTGLLHYVLLLLCLVVVDVVWIGVIANTFYKQELGELRLRKPRLVPAAIFYAFYVFTIQFMIVDPMIAKNAEMVEVVARAAVLGFAAYAAYDLTNLATLKGWSTKMSVIDIAWGVLLTVLVSLFGFMIFSR